MYKITINNIFSIVCSVNIQTNFFLRDLLLSVFSFCLMIEDIKYTHQLLDRFLGLRFKGSRKFGPFDRYLSPILQYIKNILNLGINEK